MRRREARRGRPHALFACGRKGSALCGCARDENRERDAQDVLRSGWIEGHVCLSVTSRASVAGCRTCESPSRRMRMRGRPDTILIRLPMRMRGRPDNIVIRLPQLETRVSP